MPRKLDDATSGAKLLTMYNTLITSGRKQYQADLVRHLQCSSQTVTRLAETIEGIVGTNFESDKEGRRKWYRIRSTSNRTLGLGFEELHYLSICKELGASLLPEHTRLRIEETISKLTVDMLGQGRCNEPKLSFYAKGRIDYTPYYEAINTLLRAAEERRICAVHYKANSRNGVKEHQFAPGRIVSMNNALYVLGAGVKEYNNEIRHLTNLAVHRIEKVHLTDHRFSFDLPDCSSNTFGLPWHEPRTYRIHFSSSVSDYIRERTWADEQRMEDAEDGGVVLEITTRSEPELMAWVRSFGEEAELLANSERSS